MNNSIFYGFGSSDDGNISKTVCSDPKMEYEIILDSSVDAQQSNIEWLDKDRVDYNVVLPEYKGTYLEECGVPISFLEVQTVDEGIMWYSKHTDMPDCMLPYLAEYHWGNNVHINSIAYHGLSCKDPKKNKRKKKPVPVMSITQGKFRIEFD